MKLFEINPFEEPKLTPDEELKYFQRRMIVLGHRLQKLTSQVVDFYMKTPGVYEAADIDKNRGKGPRGETLVYILIDVAGTMFKHDFCIYIHNTASNKHMKYNQLLQFQQQVLDLRKLMELPRKEISRLHHSIDSKSIPFVEF